jgi:tetratricopeptide (TPR) repeat protein
MAEKSINEISRDLRMLYQKGADALQRENVDYALDLFNQVLEKEPTFFDCRKALRAAQQKKSGGGGGGFFKKMMSNAGSSPMVAKAQLALRKNPAEAMTIAEQILNGDPNNSGAHRVILDAAMTLEMPRTAVISLEILCKNSPKDKALVIQTAEALVANGDIARAEKILAEAERNFPNDPDISQTHKNLSASKTLGEGGYESLAGGGGSFRDALRNKEEAVSLEQEKRVQKTEDVAERLINEYETRLKTEPDNLKLIRSLAELYTQKKQFAPALALYDRIKTSDMGASDATLDRAIADTKVKRLDQQLSELNPFAPEHADEVARLRAEKVAFQLAECQKRVEKFPTDLAIRFEMGALYFQAGKISEAIQEFQKAQNSPHKRVAALNYLAQCFAKRKMFDLAAKTLQNAIKEKAVFDDEKKDLIYNLGCVLESMGKKEEAIEQLKLIYEVDAGYKDVGAKVDAYYAGQ